MSFLKTTLIGGIVFLIPISFCILILSRVHRVMERVAAPFADALPLEALGPFARPRVLALVAIVVLCFLAGLLARSRLASRLVEWLESGVLHSIPGYTFVKGLTGGLAGDDPEKQLVPVLARFDDAWQLAFRVECLGDGRVVVFIPGAPDPWSGHVTIMEEGRIQQIDRKMAGAVRNLRGLGRGSREFLSPTTADKT